LLSIQLSSPFPGEHALRLLLLRYDNAMNIGYHCVDVDVGVVAGAGGTNGDGQERVDVFIVVFVINKCCKYIVNLL
jgi:hypothetical protein